MQALAKVYPCYKPKFVGSSLIAFRITSNVTTAAFNCCHAKAYSAALRNRSVFLRAPWRYSLRETGVASIRAVAR